MDSFQPIAARPSPVRTEGLLPWVRRNLFGDAKNTVVTLLMLALLLWFLPRFIDWALLKAVFAADSERCQAARGIGACWGVVTEKHRLIIFGRYPFDQQWRPEIATLAMVALLMVSCIRLFWRPWLVLLWAGVLALFFGLMHGGFAGLSVVTTDRWGGLPLTVLLATLSIVMAFPLAVVVALGRRSNLPAIRSLCVVYVELIRVLVGITLFAAAYMAEIVRGGLQAIPKGQQEAADTLGLSYWQAQRKIVLPQALALVVPGIMGNFISIFKDTSLVTIVSLYELAGATQLALDSEANWRPFKSEAYLFIAAIYFVFCFSMSRYSLWVEKYLSASKNR